MDDTAAKLGLRVSWAKTKIQNLGSGQPPLPLSILNQTTEAVDDFCFLGSILSSDATYWCGRRGHESSEAHLGSE